MTDRVAAPGPVMLITGAGRRVGAGLARLLATGALDNARYRLALHYRNARDEAEALADTIRQAGGECLTFQADLSDPASRSTLIPDVIAAFGQLDILVNNASSFDYDTLQSLTEESWDSHIAANLTAPVMLIRDFALSRQAPDMARLDDRSRGLVINILDQKILAPNPDYFSYTAGKVGLSGLTETLALALAPDIRIMGIAPGLLLPSGDQTQEEFERAWVDTPLGLGGTIEDMARTILYIARTPALTGRILTLDGGESLVRRARDVAFDGV